MPSIHNRLFFDNLYIWCRDDIKMTWDFNCLISNFSSSNLFWILLMLRCVMSTSWCWTSLCFMISGSSKATDAEFMSSYMIFSSMISTSKISTFGRHIVHNHLLWGFCWTKLYSFGDTPPHLIWICELHSLHLPVQWLRANVLYKTWHFSGPGFKEFSAHYQTCLMKSSSWFFSQWKKTFTSCSNLNMAKLFPKLHISHFRLKLHWAIIICRNIVDIFIGAVSGWKYKV